MYLYQKSLVFVMFLMCCSGTLWAQEVKKEPIAAPLSRTEEVRERVSAIERENVSSEEKTLQQKEKQQKELEQQAQRQQEELELQKAQEMAAAKERELEKATKVINPNWRNKKTQEQVIIEAKRAEVDAINQQERTKREAEIKEAQQELQQTTDEGLKIKLQNKINNLKQNPTEIGIVE